MSLPSTPKLPEGWAVGYANDVYTIVRRDIYETKLSWRAHAVGVTNNVHVTFYPYVGGYVPCKVLSFVAWGCSWYVTEEYVNLGYGGFGHTMCRHALIMAGGDYDRAAQLLADGLRP